MAQQTINVGAAPNDGTGTPLRTAFQYTNSNFTELYTAVGPSGNNIVVPGTATITGDLTVDTNSLYVNSSTNNVGLGTLTPSAASGRALEIYGGAGQSRLALKNDTTGSASTDGSQIALVGSQLVIQNREASEITFETNNSERYRLDSTGIATWSNVGGGAGTAMTLNANGLGVGAGPSYRFHVQQTLAGTASAVNPIAYIVNNGSGNTAKLTLSDAVTTDGNITLTGSATAANRLLGFGINGVQQMVLDGSGNVGIGVTPSAWSQGKAIETGFLGNALWGSAQGQVIVSNNAYFNAGWKYAYTGAIASNYEQGSGGHLWYNAPSGTAGNAITFTQAMTLDASGNLYLKTTSRLSSGVFSVAYVPGTSQGAVFQPNSDVSSPTPIQFLNSSGSGVGSITTTASATAYNISSDYRLKEAVQPLSSGLARVSALKPSIYKWKADGSSGEGFLAHELAEVVPLAVTGDKDAVDADGKPTYQGVDLSKVVPILVAAIQELTARVQTLEAK